MTAVAPPPNFQNISRQGWNGSNGVPNGATPMSSDDYRHMFMPRKSLQRANSSSSLASAASSTSTISSASSQTNGLGPAPTSEAAAWAARGKKGPRGLWPSSKTEPVSGISTARPQSIASASSGTSAASAMTALHSPVPVPSQHNGTAQTAQNGALRQQTQEVPAILHLIPMNGTFERKTITVPFYPEVLRIGRQTNNKTIPTPLNGYFDSKVLSRQHAEVWADRSGKIWIRDVKSSNGTFVNGQRLSQENRDSDPHELREQDMLELGIDIVSEDQKSIVHHKVAARVEHAGIYANLGTSVMDLNFSELENQQVPNVMGSANQQQIQNMRGRTPSQGSINSGRLQGAMGATANGAAMQQPRHPNFWLQPITMEQVVKKLNADIKAAKQQSQELHQASQYINSILITEPKRESIRSSPVKVSPVKDIKTRFSDPPAPPPQQPLPEKPDAPSLRRTETERPVTGSPVRTESKLASLADALNLARKEIESQSLHLKSLEALLGEERRAREDAEQRVSRLERESSKEQATAELLLVNGDDHSSEAPYQSESEDDMTLVNGSAGPESTDSDTVRLQQRLDTMMAEMNEMKQQMETYRLRAETAEAESATHRETLAEMIEKIREEEAKKANKASKRTTRSDKDISRRSSISRLDGSEAEEKAEEGEITIIDERDVQEHDTGALLRRAGLTNGRLAEHETSAEPKTDSQTLITRHPSRGRLLINHSAAPAIPIFFIVGVGVAVMAWLNNGYAKVER